MREYSITASRTKERSSEARGRSVVIPLDTARDARMDALCAAELLLASVGAAVLAAADDSASAMSFSLDGAVVHVHGVHRSDFGNALTVDYDLTLDTEEPEHRMQQLHERVWQSVNRIPLGQGAVQLTGRIRRGRV